MMKTAFGACAKACDVLQVSVMQPPPEPRKQDSLADAVDRALGESERVVNEARKVRETQRIRLDEVLKKLRETGQNRGSDQKNG
jgi:hypothetical protein